MVTIANKVVRVNTLVYGDAMKKRLAKSDWLRQGLRTLAHEGVNALKVGPMSSKLNVSRGSFYWHFRDIAEFRSHLLRTWQERGTDQVIDEMEAGAGAPNRLDRLIERAFNAERRLDQAIRSWAAQDEEVAGIVAGVDAKRVDYIAKLLIADGVESQKALARAAFLYWAYLGQPADMDLGHSQIAISALDDISTLFKS